MRLSILVLLLSCILLAPAMVSAQSDGQFSTQPPAAASPSDPQEDEEDTAPSEDQNFRCAGKTKCAQMDSCAEAEFYLHHCRLHRLDRDNDGIPCESLCD